jgi:hypothetical protein
VVDKDARPQPFGMWAVMLSVADLEPYRRLDFTRRYDTGWEGKDHQVSLGHQAVTQALGKTQGAAPLPSGPS